MRYKKFIFILSQTTAAQEITPLETVSWLGSDTDTTFYTVKGERHGVSFTKQFQHSEVEYTPGETLTFDTYHTADVMYHWYIKWAEEYPEIVDLYVVAKSFKAPYSSDDINK